MTTPQKLTVVARLFPSILDGSKTSTIRWREAKIVPGLMRYETDEPVPRVADVLVTRCTEMALADAALFLGRENDWPDAVMLEGMREHYPEIELVDIVTVIEHHTI